jgi:uncharacterized protein
MRQETIEAIVAWQKTLNKKDTLEITFHGGEPLVPGIEFYRMALPLLKEGISPRRVRFTMQSNLWLLTDELCDLFYENMVSIGTSLDGPEVINDSQRGQGYFKKTMAGINLARAHGIDIGCIATFTRQSIMHSQEIFNFFLNEGLNFTIHSAAPSIRYPSADRWALSAEEHGELFVSMLDRYLENLRNISISTLDSLCRSISTSQGGICTFNECLGNYLAVGPNGDIYPCQRFAGMSEFQLGNVHKDHDLANLQASPIWLAFKERQQQIEAECGNCAHLSYCRGGCPYNVLTANRGTFKKTLRDPQCLAYKKIFSAISDRALKEVFSQENLEEVIDHPDKEKGLLRKGQMLSLMREGPHPAETAQNARQILAVVVLAITNSPVEAARKFKKLGLTTNLERTEAAMAELLKRLNAPIQGLNNVYLHVTFACNLHCLHCYAKAESSRKGAFSVENLVSTCHQAARLGFRHAVITGGEPLVHPDRDYLLDGLASLRQEVKPLLTVLRTSLALPMNDNLLQKLSSSTDQVVVSLDGNQETHDARRGSGMYELTVKNLRALVEQHGNTEISLAAVLSLDQVNSAPGESVRALANDLGIRRTRFRPLLPLGRAIDSELDIVPETLWGYLGADEMLAYGFTPTTSCGFGQNLYVEPDGNAYPCYAWCSDAWKLGNINADDGLPGLIALKGFYELRKHTVNTNHLCCKCMLRYLCGGACRAWSRQLTINQSDIDAAPVDCSHLFSRAYSLLTSAMRHLGITQLLWQDVGLPSSDKPPES